MQLDDKDLFLRHQNTTHGGLPYFYYGLGLSLLSFFFASQGYGQTDQIDQTRKEITLSTESISETRIDLLNSLAEQLYNYDPDSTFFYASIALDLSEKLDYPNGKIDALRNLGGYYNRISNYDSALYFLDLGLEAVKELDYPRGRANLLSTKARTLEDKGYLTSSFEYYLRALKIKEENGLIKELPSTLNNLGLLAYRTNEYEKSLSYFLRARQIREELGLTQNIESLLTNIALVYKEQNRIDEALQLLQESKKAAEESDDTYLLSIVQHNLGLIAYGQGNYTESIELLESALKLDQSMDELYGVTKDLIALARSHLALSNSQIAYGYLQEALKLSVDTDARILHAEIHELISEIYEKRQEWALALTYHKKFKEIHDHIFNLDSASRRKDFEERYKLEREEAAYRQLLKDREQEKDQETAQILRNGIIVLLLIMSLALIISVRSVKIHRQARQQATKQKDELERLYLETTQQKEKIESIARNLEDVNRTKDRLFSIVSHDLRSPINSLNSLMQYTLDENLSQEEFTEISHKLKNEVEHVHFTLLNLLQWAKTQMRGITTDPTHISIEELVGETLDLYRPVAQSKEIKIHNTIDPSISCWADREQVNLIFRNLVNNALKFTHQGGEISLIAEKILPATWKFTVQDSGIGMDEHTVNKLFKADFNNKRYGTAGEKGTGLGLILVKDFVEKNGGELTVESELGVGSRFSFTLPETN
ncbi:hypothetical protein ADIS_4091 [Lunatimonas lonarensis]|uniref:histidine kinase n=1 Tax=Lunatimonas lonarensis TaxID=1232681 RepID=R7ZMT0_9BACT|nr:hypothetical protein ADIS_4091 [Lunatimonas lonarensis]